MKDALDIGIVSTGALVKKGCSVIIANVGKTVALITLLVTALVLFTEVSFSNLSSESFTGTLIMMLIASYVMYFSLEDAGEKLGRESDEYKSALEKYREHRSSIKAYSMESLRRFCLGYREAELEYRRENLLFSLGYTKAEYEAYLRGEKVCKKDEKALGRVKRLRSAQLDASMLISDERQNNPELKKPGSDRALRTLISLIPSTVCMIFTISVMISLKDNLTAAGVIEALVKLSTLPIIGLKGYSSGYEYVRGSEYAWLQTKTRLLEAFIKSKKEG